MSTPESTGLDLGDASVVDALMENLDNEEIASLPLGSPEQKAALDKLSGKTDEESVTSDEEEQTADDEESEDDESEETEESDEETKEDEVKNKPKKGIQKRFDEMTKQISSLKAQLEGKNKEETPAKEEAPKFDKPKPTLRQYETVDEYYEALGDWHQEKAEFAKSVKDQQTQHEEYVKRTSTDWETNAAEFKKTNTDFDDVVNVETVKTLNTLAPAFSYIVRQENGPAVMYAILSDEAKAEEFRNGDAAEQVAILTEIKLSLTSKNKTKTTVTAALEPPPNKKKGVTKTPVTYRDDMSLADVERILAQETKAKKRR